jgi:hypothetical protein
MFPSVISTGTVSPLAAKLTAAVGGVGGLVILLHGNFKAGRSARPDLVRLLDH